MIKFFSRIRRRLLRENRFTRYVVYAIGEIILVVIGILIALGINSSYQEYKEDKNIQAILRQLQKEMVTDIKDAKRINDLYIKNMGLAKDVLNDSLTIEELVEDPNRGFFFSHYVSFSYKTGSYNRIMQNIEVMPERYKILLPFLDSIFAETKNTIDDYNHQIKEEVMGTLTDVFQTDSTEYRTALWKDPQKNASELLGDDPFFKNRVLLYNLKLRNLAAVGNEYRYQAISLYKRIDSLLGKEKAAYPVLLQTLPDENWKSEYKGNYSTQDGKDTIAVTFLKEKMRLVSKKDTLSLYWDGDSYFYRSDLRSGVQKFFINDQGQHCLLMERIDSKQVYIKTTDLKAGNNDQIL